MLENLLIIFGVLFLIFTLIGFTAYYVRKEREENKDSKKKKETGLQGFIKTIVTLVVIGAILLVIWQTHNNSQTLTADMLSHQVYFSPEMRNKLPLPPWNPALEKKVRGFALANLPPDEAEEFIAIAKESHFNQFELGNVGCSKTYQSRRNWHDTGLFGINDDAWAKEVVDQKLDIYCSDDDNSKMALYIWKNHGGKKWWVLRDKAELAIRPKEWVVSARPKEWDGKCGETVMISDFLKAGMKSFTYDFDRTAALDVWVNETEHRIENHTNWNQRVHGLDQEFCFQSLGNTPVDVIFTFHW